MSESESERERMREREERKICFNLQEYLKEPLSASVHMIHTLCTDQDKRKLCIDTLCRYIHSGVHYHIHGPALAYSC